MSLLELQPGAPPGVLPLAVLSSASGLLHIYTDTALKLLLESEIAHRAVAPSSPPVAVPDLVDGFSAQEWATFARKKCAIASSVCRLNGALKKHLADGIPMKNHKSMVTHEDALQLHDPWLNAKSELVSQSPAPTVDDLWSTWNPALTHLGEDSKFITDDKFDEAGVDKNTSINGSSAFMLEELPTLGSGMQGGDDDRHEMSDNSTIVGCFDVSCSVGVAAMGTWPVAVPVSGQNGLDVEHILNALNNTCRYTLSRNGD